MEKNNDSESLIGQLDIPSPVVLVLIDGWGIAPKYSGNVFTDLKLKNFPYLIKNYPLALLKEDKKSASERYKILGASGLLTKLIADSNLSQINITESEKLLLTWHNFNGGRSHFLPKEELKVISSKTGNRQHNFKQSLSEIVKLSLTSIKKNLHDFIILNLANLDLVSATGDLEASKLAAKFLDKSLGKLVDAVLKQNGVLIISAAYGHAESMINMATELPQSGITNNPTPFIIIGHQYQGRTIGLPDTLDDDLSLIEPVGDLSRVAPTILKILKISQPDEIDAKSLI